LANRCTLTVTEGEDAGEFSPQFFLFVVLDSQDLFASSSRHSLAGLSEVILGRGEPGASRSKGKAPRRNNVNTLG
jgi:hypothetical protein